MLDVLKIVVTLAKVTIRKVGLEADWRPLLAGETQHQTFARVRSKKGFQGEP
jgi:hypothetical protein